jgi:hypothetical protein
MAMVFLQGFYMVTSFNEASGDVMGSLSFLSSFLHCLIVRGEVSDILIAQRRGLPRLLRADARGRHQVADGRRLLGPEVANGRRRHLDRRWQVATNGI